jgi:hypothetical protein
MADGTTYRSYRMGEWNPITGVPIIDTRKYKENKGGTNQTQLIEGIDYCLVPGKPKYHKYLFFI